MRMVWLALLCLIGVATTVVVKIGMSPSTGADVRRAIALPKSEVSRETTLTNSMARSSENVTMGTVFRNEKADKREVPTDEAALEVKPVKPIPLVLPTEEPKQLPKTTERILIRHWHDPLDKRSAAAQPTAKGKLSRRAQSAEASNDTSTKMPSRDR
jgi:hypothetical protein